MTRSLALALSLLALAACGGGGSSENPPPPSHLYAAKTVIGQPAFDSIPGVGPCGAATLYTPIGTVASNGTTLFVADSFQSRVLAYQPIPGSGAGPAASWAVGGTDLTTCDGVADFVTPQSLSVTGTRLVVPDPTTAKVYLYDPVPSASGTPAAPAVVGAPDQTEAGLSSPEGAIVVGGKLYVADRALNRVLVWDPAPSDPLAATPPAATFVLGQAAFRDAGGGALVAFNDADADGLPGKAITGPPAAVDYSPSASVMHGPTAVWSDGTRLVVADTGNHRLLVWNTLPTASGVAADLVIGQPNATSAAPAAGAAGLDGPTSIASDGTRLFVADTGNHRVLVYPTFPSASGASATAVLGQRTFDGRAANDDDGDGVSDAKPSAGSLDGPTGVAVISGKLYVTDTDNGRVLVFDPPTP